MIRMIGVDPGLRHIGISFGVFHPDSGLEVRKVWYFGTKKGDKKLGIRAKADDLRCLNEIVTAVDEIFRHHPADVYSFEECPSIRQNATSTRKVALAWGAIYALACRRDSVVLEYGPKTLKKAVVGKASASKTEMIQALEERHPALKNYKLAKTKREHIADACAALEVATSDPAVVGLAKAYGKAVTM